MSLVAGLVSLRRTVIVVVMINVLLLGSVGIVYRVRPDILLDVRDALYTQTTDDPEVLEKRPDSIPGFKTDPPQLRNEWTSRIRNFDFVQSAKIESSDSDLEKVRRLIRTFSRGGGPKCGVYDDLEHNMKRLRREGGYGCCSDHTEVFLGMSAAFDLASRELSHGNHTFAEFYDHQRNKWVWVDPQYALFARSPDDEAYLSARELRNRYLTERQVEFEFFGGESHVLSSKSPRELPFYDESRDFSEYILTLGNNVFEQNAFRQKLGSLAEAPKPVVQLVSFLFGVKPGYLAYKDDYSNTEKLEQDRYRLYGFGIFWVLLNVGLLYVGFQNRRLSRGSERLD